MLHFQVVIVFLVHQVADLNETVQAAEVADLVVNFDSGEKRIGHLSMKATVKLTEEKNVLIDLMQICLCFCVT